MSDNRFCSVCGKEVNPETANIVTMSVYGTPRYICEDCEADFAVISSGTEIEEIDDAIERISEKLTKYNNDDKLLLDAITNIIKNASERVEKILSGTYEESSDSDDFDEIPEEYLETEEDRELDRQEKEKNEKIDKVTNWFLIGFIAAFAVGMILYYILKIL